MIHLRDTSRQAAESICSTKEILQQRVRDHVARQGSRGATCDETEIALGLTHQTCSARFTELAKLGAITNSGLQRKTRSRRNAIVWVVG